MDMDSLPPMKRHYVKLFVFVALVAVFCSAAKANLVIDPTFDSTITSDPNAAAIEAGINAALSRVEGDISNNITVNIDYQEMSSGLGESEASDYYYTYSGYRSLLTTNQTLSANDVMALASLPVQSANPVNSGTGNNLIVAGPAMRALGQSAYVGYPDLELHHGRDFRRSGRLEHFDHEYLQDRRSKLRLLRPASGGRP